MFVLRFACDLRAAGAWRILDGGCGSGRNAVYLAGLGFDAVGIDSAANKCAEARQSAHQRPNASFVAAEIESLPFGSGTFDAAICTHVLEYLTAGQIEVAMGELRRVVREGGVLLLVTAAKEATNLDAAEELGQGDYLFRRDEVAVRIHLSDRAELDRWLEGFRVREIARLHVEHPKAATIAGCWSVVATVPRCPE
ncbi:MAG: class I SAM-dependent methyltransferase [Chloroflexi bacterium]|nr:class I SAM-dependent methyltransferase [Chloroflexota bacterium]